MRTDLVHSERAALLAVPRVWPMAVGLIGFLLGLTLLGVLSGSTGFLGWSSLLDPSARVIAFELRLPRALTAILAGALLGLSGAVAQGVFRNPLADPFLLGSASGATLGVAVWLLAVAGFGGVGLFVGSGLTAPDPTLGSFAGLPLGLTGAAFLGALAAVFLTLALARGVQHTLRLLLAGVIVGVVIGAVTSLLIAWQPQALAALQAFALGSTALVGWSGVMLLALVLLVCLTIAAAGARLLDALTLGTQTARSLGLAVGPWRLALLGVLALATGAAVAHAGLIAFVGLAAPHLVRQMQPVPARAWLLLSALMGSCLLLAADLLARLLIAPAELPVGVLTAVLGGVYLMVLMHRQSKREAA